MGVGLGCLVSLIPVASFLSLATPTQEAGGR